MKYLSFALCLLVLLYSLEAFSDDNNIENERNLVENQSNLVEDDQYFVWINSLPVSDILYDWAIPPIVEDKARIIDRVDIDFSGEKFILDAEAIEKIHFKNGIVLDVRELLRLMQSGVVVDPRDKVESVYIIGPGTGTHGGGK